MRSGSSNRSPAIPCAPGEVLWPLPKCPYLEGIRRDFELDGRAALLLAGTRQSVELSYRELEKLADECDLLLNLPGLLRDENLISRIPIRVYLDLDPAFTQLWETVEGLDLGFQRHTHFLRVGLLIGESDCPIPPSLPWIPTLQPSQLDWWPVAPPALDGAYTTVGHWRGYGSIHMARFPTAAGSVIAGLQPTFPKGSRDRSRSPRLGQGPLPTLESVGARS